MIELHPNRVRPRDIEVGKIYRGGWNGTRRKVMNEDRGFLTATYLDAVANIRQGTTVQVHRAAFALWINVWRRMEEDT